VERLKNKVAIVTGANGATAINLTGSFLGAKHRIGEMLKHSGESVIFTSTFVGYSFGFPGWPPTPRANPA